MGLEDRDWYSQQPFGIETIARVSIEDPNAPGELLTHTIHCVVESRRYNWEISGRNERPALVGEKFAERTQSDQPWTSVNNCTPSKKSQIDLDQSSNACSPFQGDAVRSH